MSVPTRDASADKAGLMSAGAFLFLCVFAFYWVTTNPYVDLTQIQPVGSNLLNQVAVLGLTAFMAIFALRSPARDAVLRPRLLLGALFLWYIITAVFSVHSPTALKTTILAIITCLNASVFLLLPRSERHFAALLLAGSVMMLAFAYFGVFFLPQRAIHQASELAEPMHAGFWRGQYTHKNVAAAVMLVGVFFGLYISGSGLRRSGLAIVILCVFFLLHTGGKTSTAMLPAILLLAFIFEKVKWCRIPIAIGGILAFNVVALGAAVSASIRDFIRLLGVDPTFTNRTDIWRIAFSAITERPILGYGFEGFWRSKELVNTGSSLETWAVNAFNGHNAYIDTLLTTGLPGFLLTMTWILILPLRDVAVAETTDNSPALTRLFVRIWLYGIYSACLESLFFQSGSPVWFAILFALFGLRMQARTHLVCEREKGRVVGYA